MRRQLLFLIAASLLVFGGVACSDDDDGGNGATTTERAERNGGSDGTEPSNGGGGDGDEQALCDALEPVSEFNAESGEFPTFSERRDYVQENLEAVTDAYDEAIDASEGEMQTNLETLRDFTVEFGELLEEHDNEADLTEAVEALDTGAAEDAGLAVDRFTTESCGFSVSG